ncbi:MAG TPA: hypothetical protein VFB25_08145 [Gaiellaceae bacterium]|nr:hypothetical protein [Gaiellaceae bacterium]
MNTLLDDRYVETVTRLALGLEIIDAARGTRISDPVRVAVESPLTLSTIPRHDSCLHALIYSKAVTTPVTVRILSPDRHFVPRRIQLPIGTQADAAAGLLSAPKRTWRPVLFPGAAYAISASATGVRGRVVWEDDGTPVRFARVVASYGDQQIGLAHGDDRGEFLLVVGPDTVDGDDFELADPPTLPVTLDLMLTIVAPNEKPAIDTSDPLSGLPVEVAAGPGLPDPVSVGEQLPDDYRNPGRVLAHAVTVPLGRITSVAATPYEIPYP